MAAFLESIDRIVAGSMRRSTSRDETYADWIAEIPEPMFRQLVREGAYRSAVSSLVLGLLLWFCAYMVPPMLGRSVSASNAATFGGLGVLYLLAAAWGWRRLAAQCLLRECIYRRLHGKWRWER